MDFDKLLEQRQAALARAMRLEGQGPACLPFVELGAAVLSAQAADHVASCRRCATLRERLLTGGQMSADELAGLESAALAAAPRRPHRLFPLMVAVAGVACLALAASLWLSRPRVSGACERLQTLVLDSTADIDRALNALVSRARDDTAERLAQQNETLRAELEALVARFELLLETARDQTTQ